MHISWDYVIRSLWGSLSELYQRGPALYHRPLGALRNNDFHSIIATLCQVGWIGKESKTFRSFGCSRIQSSCDLRQISTEMYCFGQVASRTKLSSCWHSSCNEPRGKTQAIPSFQGKKPLVSRVHLTNNYLELPKTNLGRNQLVWPWYGYWESQHCLQLWHARR